MAEIFRHPVAAEVGTLSFGPVDEDAVRRLLVDGHGFAEERVRAAVSRARRRPPATATAAEARGHQTLLETFGGSER